MNSTDWSATCYCEPEIKAEINWSIDLAGLRYQLKLNMLNQMYQYIVIIVLF